LIDLERHELSVSLPQEPAHLQADPTRLEQVLTNASPERWQNSWPGLTCLERITKTFSADRAFCEYLFASQAARTAAQILLYQDWVSNYLPDFEHGFMQMVPTHFASYDTKKARLWTTTLMYAIIRDLSLISYLVLRGVMIEAHSVGRRALEHTGVLTHLWHDPSKVNALGVSEKEFKRAFENPPVPEEGKARAVKPRFAQLLFAEAIAPLYKHFSECGIHGGTPMTFVQSPLRQTRFSCQFFIRPEDHLDSAALWVLAKTCELICCEVVNLYGYFGKTYGPIPDKLSEGRAYLLALAGGPGHGVEETAEMKSAVDHLLTHLQEG